MKIIQLVTLKLTQKTNTVRKTMTAAVKILKVKNKILQLISIDITQILMNEEDYSALTWSKRRYAKESWSILSIFKDQLITQFTNIYIQKLKKCFT